MADRQYAGTFLRLRRVCQSLLQLGRQPCDGNFVEPGDDYELTFWDGKGWSSLGRRHSEGYELRYDNIPEGALLLLHDLTKGKEERPFTLRNGRQVWW